MRRNGFVLLMISLVFWAANWVSISAGKGIVWECTILGAMASGGGMALIVAGGKVRK